MPVIRGVLAPGREGCGPISTVNKCISNIVMLNPGKQQRKDSMMQPHLSCLLIYKQQFQQMMRRGVTENRNSTRAVHRVLSSSLSHSSNTFSHSDLIFKKVEFTVLALD